MWIWKKKASSAPAPAAAAGPAALPAGEPSPAEAAALDNLIARRQFAEAALAAEALTRRYPESATAWRVRGGVLGQLGQFAPALEALQRAVALAPQDAAVHANLGAALLMLRRAPEAESHLRRALELRPDADVAHNLGVLLRDSGRYPDAESSFRQALALQPDNASALYHLAATQYRLGHLHEAEASYRRLLLLRPDHLAAHIDLSMILGELGQMEEVVTLCRHALLLDPNFAYTHANLGAALKSLGRLQEAEESSRRAVQIRPDLAEVHANLGAVLQDLGRLGEAEACYRRSLELKPNYETAQRNLLFCLNYLQRPAEECLQEARHYGKMVAAMAGKRYAAWNCASSPGRLRVGLVSGDLWQHPVGFFLESWLANVDPQVLELHAYATGPGEDALTARIRPRFAVWRNLLGISDAQAAQQIHADGVHVLIDLAGHTAHNRLPVFAWKPAPVQVSWLGYFATTGVAEIDYLIADPWTLTPQQERYFTEQVWRLPHTRLCFTAPTEAVAVAPLPALAAGQVTFGCFNHLTKVNDAVVQLWSRILAAVPGSRLLLRARQLHEPAVREAITRRFAAQGVPAARLLLEGPTTRAQYLADYGRVDIALDPFPYTGGATTAEALWMGVPVVTLGGDRFLARQGVGLLANAGLRDWIAEDPDDYVARAVRHAGDLPALARLRAGLRTQLPATPLFDAAAFARALQEALLAMWAQRRGA